MLHEIFAKENILLQSLADLDKIEERRKEKLKKVKCNLQPYIAAVDNLDEETKSVDYYICIDTTKYYIPTCLQAIDSTFKLFHSLQAQYPVECENIWLFVQQFLYEIETEWDKNSTTVNGIKSDVTAAILMSN